MKQFSYHEIEHVAQSYNSNNTGTPKYDIDWNNGEARFKNPCSSIRVYESGHVVIATNTSGDSGERERLLKTYDIDFRLLAGLRGKFFTENGTPVAKNTINTTGPMLCTNGRIYTGRWFAFESIDKPPTSSMPITLHLRNKDREADFTRNWKHMLDLGVTMRAIKHAEYEKLPMYYAKSECVGFIKNPRDLNPAVPRDLNTLLYLGRHEQTTGFQTLLQQSCVDIVELPYLVHKES